MALDRDLASIQEARDLVERAYEAQKKFEQFSQEQVDAIVDAMAEAAQRSAEMLARMAVEETGYGNVKDKTTKNLFSAVDVYKATRGMKTVGIVREDRENRILEIAVPVGVVAAIIPSTNPTSTTIYKVLIALKARNGVVVSPHPSAMRCICETADILYRAALKVGAPEGIIGCMGQATTAATQELMKHRHTHVILSTGGMGIVKAAYSSGKPAFGVGPGNVPAFVERTANVPKAVADILTGKCFDYGTICSAEQHIVADEPIREAIWKELGEQGAYFLNPEEIEKVGKLVILPQTYTVNPKVVGRAAPVIAQMVGIKVPPETRVLVAPLEGVGKQYPLSAEKLSPILAFYTVKNWQEGVKLCTDLLHFGGLGHTCVIHSQNDEVIREFGLRVPAYRVIVNSPATHGAIGYSTRLFPSMTLGCGAMGGNITSDNISPLHLLNLKRVAYETRPVEHVTDRIGKTAATAEPVRAAISAAPVPDRGTIARVVEKFLSERGVPRGGTSPQASAPAVAASPVRSAVAEPSPQVRVAEFVSEEDVREALSRQEKIYIGPRTIVTPSARDLGLERDVFVETASDARPA